MQRTVFGLVLAALMVAPAAAQMPAGGQLAADQKGYIVYDQCMLHAAMDASHTDARNEEIFALAKAKCAPTRAAVIVGQEHNQEFLAALDAADAEKSGRFPTWIKGVRERRLAFEAQAAAAAPPRQ